MQQLNALAGEGKSRVVSKDGAHQLVSEPVGGRLKLTLHRDGFLLRRGPFRPYARESSRLFIQDILDGFFPYELKERCVNGTRRRRTHTRVWALSPPPLPYPFARLCALVFHAHAQH